MRVLTDPQGTQIYHQGPPLENRSLPAFFYFALSGEESLTLDPYHQPAHLLIDAPLHVFSLTIPGHGEGFDKYHAIGYWAEEMKRGEHLLEAFFDKVCRAIDWLVETGTIDPASIAVGGLSRGAFVATHIAARDTRIKTLIGFAPLTRLSRVAEFADCTRQAEALDFDHLTDKLTHLHHLRYYISNHDTRVDTDACYSVIRKLALAVHAKRARHCHIELFLTPPIGHKGHGTAPHNSWTWGRVR